MDILDNVNEHPEPNMHGVNFDCQRCGQTVQDAFYDRKEDAIYYWCSEGHESVIEEVMLDI